MGNQRQSLPDKGPSNGAGIGDNQGQTLQAETHTQTQEEIMTTENGAIQVADDPTPPTQPKRVPDSASLQDQLRAVTKERSRLSARVSELEPLQAEIAKLRSSLGEQQTRYTQDMHLVELGISSARARRSIRREWRDEVAEQDGEDKLPFEDFVGSLKQDEFYGGLFTPPKQEQPESQDSKPRKVEANPNAGASQPVGTARPFDEAQYRNVASREQRLELARKHGLIK